MFEKIKGFLKSKKLGATLAVSSAIPVMAVAASAETVEETANPISLSIETAGSTVMQSLTAALPTVVATAVSIGMIIVGVWAVKGVIGMAKNVFTSIGKA